MSIHTGTTHRFDEIHSGPYKDRAFRLFKLYPGSPSSDIEGELLTCQLKTPRASSSEADLEAPGSYEALPYYWGPVIEDGPVVLIRGKMLEKPSKIQITRNLGSALQTLRDSTHPKRMWIDALCIDQRNQEEKGSQISHMSVIFNSATAVRVWLGPEETDAGIAFPFVQRCLESDEFDKAMQDPQASKDLQALVSVMKKPWFSRRWIVQEIALAKTAELHCGRYSLQWQEFADVVSQLSSREHEIKVLFKRSPEFQNHADYLGEISELGAMRLVDITDDLFYKTEDNLIREKNFTLEALISTMSAFQSSVAHDVVYAVLWLANDAHGVFGIQRESSVPVSPASNERPMSRGPLDDRMPNTLLQGRHSKAFQNRDMQTNAGSSAKRQRFDQIPLIQVENASFFSSMDVEEFDKNDSTNGSQPFPSVENGNIATSPTQEKASILPITARYTDKSPSTLQPNSPTNLEPFFGRKRSLSDATMAETEKQRIAVDMWNNALKRSRIYLDYNKSIFSVCSEVLEFMVTRSRSLDILCRPWAPDDPNDSMFPSWIQRLNKGLVFKANFKGRYQRVNADPLLGKFEPSGPPYRASSNLMVFSHWEFRKDLGHERSFFVQGLKLHTIATSELKSNATSGTIPADRRIAAQWYGNSLPPHQFWRTLVGNRNAHGRQAPQYWRRACHEAFQEAPEDDDLQTERVLAGIPGSRVQEFLQRVQCVVWNRRLARINLEHTSLDATLCLVPRYSQAGDIICVLYGCSVPVLLRPHGTRDNLSSYKLLGECYVHGVMNGEALSIRTAMMRKLPRQADTMFELV